MTYKDRERQRRRNKRLMEEAEIRGRRDGEASMQEKVEALEAESRLTLRQMTKERREQERMDWHNSPLSCGYPLLPTAAFLLVCVGAVPAEMLAPAVVWASDVADTHKFRLNGWPEREALQSEKEAISNADRQRR